MLADRWGIDTRTVIRLCRYHEIREIQLVPGGRILYPRSEIETLEEALFRPN